MIQSLNGSTWLRTLFILTSTLLCVWAMPLTSQAFFALQNVPLDGYAWSSNIGWIAMSGATHGVTVNTDGTLSGYAWSSNIGWIKFGGLSGFPTGGGTVAENANLVETAPGSLNYELRGWARACAGTLNGDCSSMENYVDPSTLASDVSVTSGAYGVECPSGKYATDLLYEGTTWTNVADNHVSPENPGMRCVTPDVSSVDSFQTVALPAGALTAQCPTNHYITGLNYESATWTLQDDSHINPEIQSINCQTLASIAASLHTSAPQATPGSYTLSCPAGQYITGLSYEGATWTNQTDTHAAPEISGIECASITTVVGSGWDGWISLSGSNYAISLSAVGAANNSYAWGSNVIGWVDFSRVGVDASINQIGITWNRESVGPHTPNQSPMRAWVQFSVNVTGGLATGTTPYTLTIDGHTDSISGVYDFGTGSFSEPLRISGVSAGVSQTARLTIGGVEFTDEFTLPVDPPNISIVPTRSLLRQGDVTAVSVRINPDYYQVTCDVRGAGINQSFISTYTGALFEVQLMTSPVRNQTRITVSCRDALNPTTPAYTATTDIQVIPTFQEF